MMPTKPIRINKKGMITIPKELRKKYELMEGTEIVILDIEGVLTIVPIYDEFSDIQKKLPSRNEIAEQNEINRKQEIELENDEG